MMRYQKLTTAAIMVSMLLTGCAKDSAQGDYASTAGIVGTPDNHTVQAYALPNISSFDVVQNGMKVNPMTAPSNQVYYFTYDSNQMDALSTSALMLQANYLVANPNAVVRLEGNTDERGSREYNIGLGWRRDQSVARLLEQQGVSPDQIKMVSYGKERPVAFGHNEAAWKLNRTVNLVYEVVQ